MNPKAFINAHNFSTIGDLIGEVKRIDNDKNAYEEMLNEKIFLDNFDPIKYYENKIFNFLDYIISQGPELAKRRGEGQRQHQYESFLKDIMLLGEYSLKYCIRYKHLINGMVKLSSYPRNLMRKVRNK